MNWLSSFMDFTSNHEAQRYYHEWTGLYTIASVISRRVWTTLGYGIIFPNLYVMLIGNSSLARKSATMEIVELWLRDLHDKDIIRLASESLTFQRLVDELTYSEVELDLPDPKSPDKPYKYMSLTSMNTELSSFIKIGDNCLVDFVIELYDCKSRYHQSTRSLKEVSIYNACLNLLGATTPAFFADRKQEINIINGFSARCVWLYAETRRFNRPFPPIDRNLESRLKEELEIIAQVKGEITLSMEARNEWTSWYESIPLKPTCIRPLQPFYGRIQTYSIKLAILYAVMDYMTTGIWIITKSHIEASIDVLTRSLPHMEDTFSAIANTEDTGMIEQIDIIISYLQRKSKPVLEDNICSENYIRITPSKTREILNILAKQHTIKKLRDKGTGSIYYQIK